MAKKRSLSRTRRHACDFKIRVASSEEDFSRFKEGVNKTVLSNTVISNRLELNEALKRDEELQKQSKITASPEEMFKEIMENPSKEIMFLTFKKSYKDLGFAVISFNNAGAAEIEMFSVYERGTGFGSVFYIKLEGYLKERDIMLVKVKCPYEGAKKFWKRIGFESNTSATVAEQFFKFI